MDQSTGFLNRYIVPPLNALSENTYMSAIRAGMVSIVPLTIIGGLFIILCEMPIPGWKDFIAPCVQLLQIPVAATFGLLSVFVCFFIGYDLGKQFGQEAVVSAAMATLVFLMVQLDPQTKYAIDVDGQSLSKLEASDRSTLEKEDSISLSPGTITKLGPLKLAKDNELSFAMENLGSKGLFTAIIIAIVSVRIQRLLTDWNIVIKLPKKVPPVVYESFVSLTPLFVLVLVFWFVRFVAGIDINSVVQAAFQPLVFSLTTLPGILVYAFLVTMLWSIGINGDNAMDALVAPIFLRYLVENVEAVTAGTPLPHITAYGFFTTFVNVGGTGATIALALILLRSKEPSLRKVSRLSLPTQIFQINEPIFFGLPIVLNPIFMIPYVLSALLLTTGTYLLMEWEVIQKPFVNVPWTTPPVIGHYLVTGGDWRAAIWGAVSIGIAMVVYYPFAKIAERERLKAEEASIGN